MRRFLSAFCLMSILVCPLVFAQPTEIPGQNEWMALMKKQMEARRALNEQLQVERDQFLKDHPEMAAEMEAQATAAKERSEKLRAEFLKKAPQGLAP